MLFDECCCFCLVLFAWFENTRDGIFHSTGRWVYHLKVIKRYYSPGHNSWNPWTINSIYCIIVRGSLACNPHPERTGPEKQFRGSIHVNHTFIPLWEWFKVLIVILFQRWGALSSKLPIDIWLVGAWQLTGPKKQWCSETHIKMCTVNEWSCCGNKVNSVT